MHTVELEPRNKSKAVIRMELRSGRQIVIKDYSAVENPILRMYGMMTLRNEARAYSRLESLEGIPICYGIKDRDRLELSFVPGKRLALFKRRSVTAEVFDRLEAILREMHARGVANMDLHRSNVLVADDGSVHIIDFAHAIIARHPRMPGLFTRIAMRLDWYAFQRMKAHFVGLKKTVPEGAFGVLYRLIRGGKHLLRLVKKRMRGA